MRCPSCNGKRFISSFDGGRDECYLCRSLGVVTPEAQRAWAAEQDAERIRQIRVQLARDAMESTQWEQLSFAWGDTPKKVKNRKNVRCVVANSMPSTDHRQHSLAFEDLSEIPDGQQQHGSHAQQLAAI